MSLILQVAPEGPILEVAIAFVFLVTVGLGVQMLREAIREDRERQRRAS